MGMSKSLSEIKGLYSNFGLDEEAVWHRTKKLLTIYRKVVWSIKGQANNMVAESVATYGRSLEEALSFLYDFAPLDKKQDFESKVQYMFETKWLIDLIDKSLIHVRSYPDKGDIYYEIIYNVFLGEKRINDTDCMGLINMEKTTYYQRKKEAIYLMGIALWGYAIPEIRQEVNDMREYRKQTTAVLMAN